MKINSAIHQLESLRTSIVAAIDEDDPDCISKRDAAALEIAIRTLRWLSRQGGERIEYKRARK